MMKLHRVLMDALCLVGIFASANLFLLNTTFAQCAELPGTIGGKVFLDSNTNGINENHDGLSSVLVNLYDEKGNYIDHKATDIQGNYLFENLDDGKSYRVEFKYSDEFYSTKIGEDSKTSLQVVEAPTCNTNFGLVNRESLILDNLDLGVTCFVQGLGTSNGGMATVVSLPASFDSGSHVNKISDKDGTGSVWGLAYNQLTREMFSSSFIKQYAYLNNGHDAIYVSDLKANTTSLFTKLGDLGIEVGVLPSYTVDNCDYGNYVGKIGIGGLEISEDYSTLYTVNIANKSVVVLPTNAPNASNTKEFVINGFSCSPNSEFYPFALKQYKGDIYVGVTCIVPGSKVDKDSYIKVLRLDETTGDFTEIFSTNYNKGNWQDIPANNYTTDHWLTDIDFTLEGNMILGLTDRTGHRFCNASNRLDEQFADILMVWNNNGVWTLESNGVAGSLTGTGSGNNQGPDGGEFFGHDFFPANPNYHYEVAFGSFVVIEGTNQVVATVYDPENNTYSGGLHKYRTTDGYKLSSKELYTSDVTAQFGKATGLGDVEPILNHVEIEIGNFVWSDTNQDGIQDPSEQGVPDIQVAIYDSNFKVVGQTKTDKNGHYLFNDSNVDIDKDGTFDGLLPSQTYYVTLSPDQWNASKGFIELANGLYSLTNSNMGAYSSPDLNDNDATIATNINSVLNGLPVIKVQTLGSGNNNHSYDFGLATFSNFDLALRKTTLTTSTVKYGDKISFNIEVFNQGGMLARKVEVVDYLPVGFHFDPSENAGWKQVGNKLYYTFSGDIAIDNKKEIQLHLFAKDGASYEDFINYAEISKAETQYGTTAVDVDSQADNTSSNDNGGVPFQSTDDQIDDNGTIDEDDHDVAVVNVFDLALDKKIKNLKNEYVAGDIIDFEITVYNQGNVDAVDIEIVDYQTSAFDLHPDSSNKWSLLTNGNVVTRIKEIKAGAKASVIITMILKDAPNKEALNVAEISKAYTPDGQANRDLDSTPNDNPIDDKGGIPFSNTNDLITDHGNIDEDDHDPEAIPFDRFDLALMKKVNKKFVVPGEVVEFTIEVMNQGSMTAGDMQIVDYLPEGLELIDDNWLVDPTDPTRVLRMLTMDNGSIPAEGLLPNKSIFTTIIVKVKDNVKNPSEIINYAEISYSEDYEGNNRSLDDYDSTPDKVMTNDKGGNVYSIFNNFINGNGVNDEDDHDPELLVIYDGEFVPAECVCLNNAEVGKSGQFYTSYRLDGVSGDWQVVNAEGFEEGLNPLGTEPDFSLYNNGDYVETSPFNTTTNLYADNESRLIEGIRPDGEPFVLELTDGTDTIRISRPACNYNPLSIVGNDVVCHETEVIYCVDPANQGPYEWTLTDGGNIVGPTDEECVTINWSNIDDNNGTNDDSGPFQLSVTSLNGQGCIGADSLDILVGVPGGSMSAISNVQVSLGESCEFEVTPDVVVKYTIPENVVFDIALINPDGTMQADNILDVSDIGNPIMVKIIEPCTGNSTWSTITVEDKLAPIFTNQDTTIGCHQLNDLTDPVVEDNCDNNVTITLIGETINQSPCPSQFTHTIVRTYTATDLYGNVSEVFVRNITLERVNLQNIDWPADRTVATTPLYCQAYEVDENGNPNVSETGVPTMDGVDIYPYQSAFCGLGMTYNDEVVDVSSCVTKVKRTWTAAEWYCDESNFETHVQMINIVDDRDPVFTAPDDITITTMPSNCTANVNLPSVSPTDDCATTFRVDITYPGGFIENQNGGIVDLPLGEHLVQYTVYDDCLNSTSRTFMVAVVDETPPVMNCMQTTSISLNSNGVSYAYAEVFDNATIDDCSLDSLSVRRMDNGDACGLQNYNFSDKVEFCCADIGEPVLIILKAVDSYGNENECMVEVIVTDKVAPSIVCPEDMTVNCDFQYDLTDLASTFGSAVATDNCAAPEVSETYSNEIDATCKTGELTRIFTATDGTNVVTCSQIITFANPNPFQPSSIEWPLDYTTNESCDVQGLLPEDLPYPYNKPVITTAFCDNIALNYEDKIYNSNLSACYKIVRKWTVMDWCNFDADGHAITYIHDQTIVLTNEVKPVITSDCSDINKCVLNNCEKGLITLTASATDDCTPAEMMKWKYSIDLESDGSFDIVNFGIGNSISLSDSFELGTHTIIYQFDDICGNTQVCTQNFTLVNCDLPTAICHDISVGVEPIDTDGDGVADNEIAIIFPSNIDENSYGPCGEPITLAFDSLATEFEKEFDCSDIGIQVVRLYVITASGDFDYCEATVTVEDNNDVSICPEFEECIGWPESTVDVDNCVPNLLPETLNSIPTIDADCICDTYTIDYTDTDISNIGDACVNIQREWVVTFTCNSATFSYTFTQTINQLNGLAPKNVICPDDITATATNLNCNVLVTVDLPTYDQDCTTGVIITNNSTYADSNTGSATGVYPLGVTTVTYTVTNACGLSSTCSVDITVEDGIAPICNSKNIEVVLDENGEYTIADDEVNNGSFDPCNSIPMTFETTPTDFTCDDLGQNTVTMTVTDANGLSSTCTAIVTVLDTISPICNAQSITYTLINPNGTMILTDEMISLIDDGSYDPCGTIVDFSVEPNEFGCDDIGVQDVIFTVTDNYGNTSSCETTIIINDLVSPVCNTQDITINVETDGTTTITADMIDNGSSDGCGVIVNRELSQSEFTCDDLGENTVTLTVTDNSGNTSQCEAIVTVENPSELDCAAEDITVYLDENGAVTVTPMEVGGSSMAPCGSDITLELDATEFFCNDAQQNPTIVTLTVTDNTTGESLQCEAEITILDTLSPILTCPADITLTCDQDLSDPSIFGEITVTDNCPGSLMTDTIMVDNRDACGLGTIERTYAATDISGNESSCTQIVTFELGDPFDENDITWPTSPLLLDNCISIDPDEINSAPVIDISNVSCSNIAPFIYTDDHEVTSCVDTFIRTWTIVDSCQLDGVGGGIFMFDQTIIVNDISAPIITVPGDTIVAYVGESCNAEVDLSAFSVTDCTEISSGINSSPFADDMNSLDASGLYELGLTDVTLAATDACGNLSSETYVVEVLDTLPPTTDCMKTQPIIGADGTVTISPSAMILSAQDNCTSEQDIQFRFIEDWSESDPNPFDNPYSTEVTFTCDDVEVDPFVTILFFDESMNFGICIGPVDVIDPQGICPGTTPNGLISGHIENNVGHSIDDVNMFLTSDSEYGTSTNAEGDFDFYNLNNGNYTLRPSKNDELLNGVTTLDIVLIQKHILGLQKFNNPYNSIAADVNNSGTITGADIILLRKNLLGIQSYFNNNESFRFLESDYEFSNPTDPFTSDLPETSHLTLNDTPITQDYTAIKIGDVNGTYQASNLDSDGISNRSMYNLYYDERNESGEFVEIPIKAADLLKLQGLQLDFNTNGYRFMSVKSGVLEISETNYNILDFNQTLRLIWTGHTNEINAHDVLFTLVLQQVTNKPFIELRQESIQLIIDQNTEAADVRLRGNEPVFIQNVSELLLNSPNPWTDQTSIPFLLTEDAEVIFNFYTLDGQLLQRKTVDGKKGYQSLIITDSDITATGMIIYEMKVNEITKHQRMIKLR